jgi:hypothetical protein
LAADVKNGGNGVYETLNTIFRLLDAQPFLKGVWDTSILFEEALHQSKDQAHLIKLLQDMVYKSDGFSEHGEE